VHVVVQLVVVYGAAAVGVVPPVAHKHLLVEDGALGAEEAVLATVRVAVVVDLYEKVYIYVFVIFYNL
jgi:hypothetical protein